MDRPLWPSVRAGLAPLAGLQGRLNSWRMPNKKRANKSSPCHERCAPPSLSSPQPRKAQGAPPLVAISTDSRKTSRCQVAREAHAAGRSHAAAERRGAARPLPEADAILRACAGAALYGACRQKSLGVAKPLPDTYLHGAAATTERRVTTVASGRRP